MDNRRGANTSDAATLHTIWSWIAADERVPFLRLFFEMYVDALTHPERYGGSARAMVDDWLGVIADDWSADTPARRRP
jgi:hypothetical protein